MNIIDGKKLAEERRLINAEEIAQLAQKGIKPSLAVVLVGDNDASKVYVRNKIRACEKWGIRSIEHRLPASTTEEELIALIKNMNEDSEVNGILVQLPLPSHICEETILNLINPEKDVDGFSDVNAGKVMRGTNVLTACTPKGIVQLIKSTGTEIKGKNCVIIGRSNIVGKPIAMLMLNESATVTVCHSKTQNLAEITSKADILISAIGVSKFVKADMVKEGAVVIDVGINRDENNKLCGDVDFENVSPKCSFITPVPGGVGPMTISCLMENTVIAAKMQNR